MEDLDKLRDEKVLPMVNECLGTVAELGFPGEVEGQTDLRPVGEKLLKTMLDADLNHLTEAPYLFQNMLTNLSTLNKVIQEATFIAIDDARYNEIAKKAFSFVTLGETEMLEAVNKLFDEEKLNKFEVSHVTNLIFSTFKAVQQTVMSSVDTSMKKAEEKIWGCDIEQVTMKMIDEKLKEGVE